MSRDYGYFCILIGFNKTSYNELFEITNEILQAESFNQSNSLIRETIETIETIPTQKIIEKTSIIFLNFFAAIKRRPVLERFGRFLI